MTDRASDRSARALDDEEDREELRSRYYGLLQELRVLLPGTQVLVAFMFTAPFQQRFTALDESTRNVFGLALVAGVLAIVAFSSPTALHRYGQRTDRAERLAWSVRLTRIGLVLFALAIIGATDVVGTMLFEGTAWAHALSLLVAGALIATWIVLPVLTRLDEPTRPARRAHPDG